MVTAEMKWPVTAKGATGKYFSEGNKLYQSKL